MRGYVGGKIGLEKTVGMAGDDDAFGLRCFFSAFDLKISSFDLKIILPLQTLCLINLWGAWRRIALDILVIMSCLFCPLFFCLKDESCGLTLLLDGAVGLRCPLTVFWSVNCVLKFPESLVTWYVRVLQSRTHVGE